MHQKDKVKVSVAAILFAIIGMIWLWKGVNHLYLKITVVIAFLIWLITIFVVNKKY